MHDPAEASAKNITIRDARRDDVQAIVRLFADDDVGGHGDTNDPDVLPAYLAAFDVIAASAGQSLHVAVDAAGAIVGTFQTTVAQSMAGRGARSLVVEGVQVAAQARSRGIGAAMLHHAIEEARRLGASKVKLTSNVARLDAHRFYERLGFRRSHAGFSMKLS
jgi:GNAT superfamily N-acetyltransferase